MSKGSFVRQMRRLAMKEQGKTFKERVYDSIRTGKPIQTVTFNYEVPKKK